MNIELVVKVEDQIIDANIFYVQSKWLTNMIEYLKIGIVKIYFFKRWVKKINP